VRNFSQSCIHRICFSTPVDAVIPPCRRRRSVDFIEEAPFLLDHRGSEVKLEDIISATKVRKAQNVEMGPDPTRTYF